MAKLQRKLIAQPHFGLNLLVFILVYPFLVLLKVLLSYGLVEVPLTRNLVNALADLFLLLFDDHLRLHGDPILIAVILVDYLGLMLAAFAKQVQRAHLFPALVGYVEAVLNGV